MDRNYIASELLTAAKKVAGAYLMDRSDMREFTDVIMSYIKNSLRDVDTDFMNWDTFFIFEKEDNDEESGRTSITGTFMNRGLSVEVKTSYEEYDSDEWQKWFANDVAPRKVAMWIRSKTI